MITRVKLLRTVKFSSLLISDIKHLGTVVDFICYFKFDKEPQARLCHMWPPILLFLWLSLFLSFGKCHYVCGYSIFTFSSSPQPFPAPLSWPVSSTKPTLSFDKRRIICKLHAGSTLCIIITTHCKQIDSTSSMMWFMRGQSQIKWAMIRQREKCWWIRGR